MNHKNKELRGLIYSKYNTEAEMADFMGWHRQKLNKITNGIKIPDVNELNELANALEEPIGEIAILFLPK